MVQYNNDQRSYTFDANNDLVTSELQRWTAGAWQNYDRYTYQYDTYHDKIYQLHEYYGASIFLYQPADRYYYYYKQINTGIVDENFNTLVFYSNPVIGKEAHIRLENAPAGHVIITICDLMGRIMSAEERAVDGNEISLNLASLSAGQYVVNITDYAGLKYHAIKLVKE